MLLLRKVLYTVGAAVALVATLGGGGFAVVAAGRGDWGSFAAAASVAALGAGFIWLAHRRTNALEAERRERERSESAAALEAALAAPITEPRFVARHKRGALAVAWVIAVAVAWAAVLLWPKAVFIAAMLALMAGLLLWHVVPATANRDAVIVDIRGVEVRGNYGLIPWRSIRKAFFWSHRQGLQRLVRIRLEVDDADEYRRSLGFLRRLLRRESGLGDTLEIAPVALDRSPEEVFAAIRRFHERMVPKGTLMGDEGYYRVDPQAARLDALHRRIRDLFDETRREAEALDRSGRVDQGSPAFKTFEQATERRLKEVESLDAEAERLTAEQLRELDERMRRAGGSMSRVTWLLYGGLALVLAVIVASAWLA